MKLLRKDPVQMAYTVNFITMSASKTLIIREVGKARMEQGLPIREIRPKNSATKKWLNLEPVTGTREVLVFS